MKTENQKKREYTKLIHEGENVIIAPPGTINAEGGGSEDVYTKSEVDAMIEEVNGAIDSVSEDVGSLSGDLDDKMDKVNPTGTGAFSLNRKAGTTTGTMSVTFGNDGEASGPYSHAEGTSGTASGAYSHAEGSSGTASGAYSHVEGHRCRATANYSKTEGYDSSATYEGAYARGNNCRASNEWSHAEGRNCTASGEYSHAEGYNSTSSGARSYARGIDCNARGDYSHAEGYGVNATKHAQMAFGEYNDFEPFTLPSDNGLLEIVGNGSGDQARSNARTLDWDGNEWLHGYLTTSAIRLRSTTSGSTKIFEITVDDNGTLTATEVV